MSGRPGTSTEADLLALDLETLIVSGLPVPSSRAAARLFAEGAVAAAVRADQLDVQPRSLTLLSEIVRRGGVAVAADLPEPLPRPDQSELVRPWFAAALRAGSDVETANRWARWLDAVAAIVTVRRDATPRTGRGAGAGGAERHR